MNNRQELAERIKAIRKLRKLSQQDLAIKSGISKVSINSVEHEGNVTLDTLDAIGKALNHKLY